MLKTLKLNSLKYRMIIWKIMSRLKSRRVKDKNWASSIKIMVRAKDTAVLLSKTS